MLVPLKYIYFFSEITDYFFHIRMSVLRRFIAGQNLEWDIDIYIFPSGKTGLPFQTFRWNEPKSHVPLILSYRIFRKIFVNGVCSDFGMSSKNIFGKCLLLALSANGWEVQNMASSFSRQENSSMEKALFDWPIVLQYDVKAKYLCFLESSRAWNFFTRASLNQSKATRV